MRRFFLLAKISGVKRSVRRMPSIALAAEGCTAENCNKHSIGGVLGILIGAASGAVAGNTVGKLLYENVMRMYRCTICNYQWRAV